MGKYYYDWARRPAYADDSGFSEPDDVTPHTHRHSVAYRIIQADGDCLEDVQLRLRHANRQTTDQIYSHLVPRSVALESG